MYNLGKEASVSISASSCYKDKQAFNRSAISGFVIPLNLG